ncbi:MAG TPA: NeuD/PglB/VioB family sugar acetyltransferase [Anaerolineales bacterium]|jgi:sugar O-acyltransferase (sialic acid O-acetyltransferase NeuD family)
MTPTPILVPLLNANEPEARLIEIHVADGLPVQKGDLLLTIETTKAAEDIEAPQAGFFRKIATEGDTLSVGDTLAYLLASADEPVPVPVKAEADSDKLDRSAGPLVDGEIELRITKPARALAESLGVDLSKLPADRLITEAVIRQFAGPSRLQDSAPINAQIVIYGAGGHAKAVMEMVLSIGAFRIAGIVDDNPDLTGTSVLGIPVLGTRDVLPVLYEQGVRLAANGVGGIINIGVRVKLFELLTSQGFAFPILRHPRATIEPSAQVFDGVQVFANAYIGSSTVLHEKCMVNTGAIVSHDCAIGSYSHIAPGAMLAGHVSVGEKVLIGMGVTTTIGIKVGAGARIGNGAILLADVPERAIVPAGKVWAV